MIEEMKEFWIPCKLPHAASGRWTEDLNLSSFSNVRHFNMSNPALGQLKPQGQGNHLACKAVGFLVLQF
jgi:hypothetical protein